MSEPFIGEIRALPYTFVPAGWLSCNGQQVSIAAYQALYAVIGNKYGGDGVNNFNLPNLQAKVPLCFGDGSKNNSIITNLAATNGRAQVTLNSDQMAAHTHNVTAGTALATSATAQGNVLATGSKPGRGGTPVASNNYTAPTNLTTLNMASVGPAGATGNASSHENRQPFLAFYFAIAWDGIFPTHS